MPREIHPASYECDCGHVSHFFENTVREAKERSWRKPLRLVDGEPNEHTILFSAGEMVDVLCPIATQREPRALDTQTIELIGRHRLASELMEAGLEVAFPARDRGVDLIAYADIDAQLGRFVARPIQMKAASQCSFGVWSKYLKINDLLLAYVWNVGGDAVTYALTCREAIAIADAMGWTRTASWTEKGGYVTTRPTSKLYAFLEPHRMTPDKWRRKVTPNAEP